MAIIGNIPYFQTNPFMVELMFMVVTSVYNPLELSITIVYYAYISPLLTGTAPPYPSAVPNVWVVND